VTRLFRSRVLALFVALAVLATLSTQRPSPANAAALTGVGWAVSNSQISATGITYSWQFTPATTATLSSITMTVPAGTAGSPAIAANYGIGAGSVGMSGTTVTYTVTVPASIGSTTPIYIELSGFTNTGTAGAYTSVVTTDDGASVDTGTSAAVTFGATTTAATVIVSKSMTVTNDTTAFTLLMDPGVAALSDLNKDVTLNVKTNAGNGYSLNVKAGLLTSGGLTIPAASNGIGTGVAAGAFAANTFGYKMTATAGNASGVAAQGAGLSTSGDFVGYTSGGEAAATATGPTGAAGDTIVLNNRVKISYDTPGGVYTTTITYTVTPSY
jgi:hypothetical protein